MSTKTELDVASGVDSDTESIFTSHSYSALSLSDGSDVEQGDVAESSCAPSDAFQRLKSLLQQRDHQLVFHADQRFVEGEPGAVSAETALLKVQAGCTAAPRMGSSLTAVFQLGLNLPQQQQQQQSEEWSAGSPAIPLQGSTASLRDADESDAGPAPSPVWDAASNPQDPSLPAESPSICAVTAFSAELLQIQAQKAAVRAQQRQQKQQQVLLLQQALAQQHQAAGTPHSLARSSASQDPKSNVV